MKRIVILMLLLSISTFCFAYSATSWFAPYPAGFNVNLLDSSSYPGIGTTTVTDFPANGYNDPTIVALVGVMLTGDNFQNSIAKISISMDFKGDTPWTYVSASEPYLKRPFGLDFVVCYDDSPEKNPRDVISIRPDSNNGATVNYNESSFTENKKNYGCELPVINGKTGEVTLELPLSAKTPVVWMDIVLALPSNVDMSTALSADDYYCGINITLDVVQRDSDNKDTLVAGGHNSWTYSFNGYISSRPDATSARVFFNLLPNATANSINVSDLQNRNSLLIGSYTYETQSFLLRNADDGDLEYDYQKYNNYYIFASSSKDPTDAGGKFALTLQGLDPSQTEGYSNTSFNYEIGIQSANAGKSIFWVSNSPSSIEDAKDMEERKEDPNKTPLSVPSLSDDDAWFDGTESTATWSTGNEHPPILGTRVEEDMRDHMKSLVFKDSGDIYIRATNAALDPTKLSPGVYTSTVYFHVISNF
ncbi:MAG: hypothetical protein IAC42_06920 [Spirochaetes bacterium]|uniref:Uncharacterized protein n=1 Tax=Candidatus Aphodenecus pullistercoris TaxID=2840669 RepID=A0A9D9H719_9SPIR|nr:hypothetical protein [Candidatus Aphodenecus pullistercoris]